jgi:hypothetical protein
MEVDANGRQIHLHERHQAQPDQRPVVVAWPPDHVGWGRARINCNLLWYGAFTAIPHTTKQSAGKGMGGGVSSTSYTYTASIIMGLCEGGATGIQDVRTVYRDKSALTLSGAGSQPRYWHANAGDMGLSHHQVPGAGDQL